MSRWRYTLALPWFSGEIEAENEKDAAVAAIEQAREDLDWNREWWGASDITVEEVRNARDEAQATP